MQNNIIQERTTVEALSREFAPIHIVVSELPDPRNTRDKTIAIVLKDGQYKGTYILHGGNWLNICKETT